MYFCFVIDIALVPVLLLSRIPRPFSNNVLLLILVKTYIFPRFWERLAGNICLVVCVDNDIGYGMYKGSVSVWTMVIVVVSDMWRSCHGWFEFEQIMLCVEGE